MTSNNQMREVIIKRDQMFNIYLTNMKTIMYKKMRCGTGLIIKLQMKQEHIYGIPHNYLNSSHVELLNSGTCGYSVMDSKMAQCK